MNDADAEVQIKRVERIRDDWIRPTGFANWTLNHDYCRDGYIAVDGVEQHDTLFSVEADWRYMQIYVRINLQKLKQFDDGALARHYLHEIAHCYLTRVLTAPEGEARREAVEHICTMIGNALFWSRRWGMDDARRERKKRKAEKLKKAAWDALPPERLV